MKVNLMSCMKSRPVKLKNTFAVLSSLEVAEEEDQDKTPFESVARKKDKAKKKNPDENKKGKSRDEGGTSRNTKMRGRR